MNDEVNLLKRGVRKISYGIDASSANKEKRTGVENYCRLLIEAMKGHGLGEDESVVLYSPDKLDEQLGNLPQGWTNQVLKWWPKRGWMSIRVNWEMSRRPPDVLFVPGQAIPPFMLGHGKTSVVTTIHDLAFDGRPDLYDSAARCRLKKAAKRAVKKAARVIVPTEATKIDLIKFYKISTNKITVIHEAANKDLYRPYTREQAMPALQKYRLGAHYFLTVGRLEKKKNIINLIRAFELFKNHRGVGDPFELVFIGEPGYGYERMKKFFDLSSHKGQIRRLGYVPDEEVAPLMSRAAAYLFPSWYEGFGIPNLEAMAVGTALITSDIPAHEEVVGEAGLLVPPGEPEAWARALERIARDESFKTELIAKGFERVKRFSRERTAKKTWDLLRSLV